MKGIRTKYVVQHDRPFDDWQDDRSFADKDDAEWWLNYRRLARPGFGRAFSSWRLLTRIEKYDYE